MQETWVQPLSQEDRLEKGMATHSSILAGRILWSEEPGWLQSMGLQRVRHGWLCTHTSLSADSADPETTIGPSLAGWSLGVGTLSQTACCPQAWSQHLRSMETSVLHQDQATARWTVIPGPGHMAEREVRSRVKRGGLEGGWEGSLGEKSYMYMYGWVALLYTWNYHNIVNRLCVCVCVCVCMCGLLTQSCLTLCNPIDCSLPGSSVHGAL